jgi:hypothetical protein
MKSFRLVAVWILQFARMNGVKTLHGIRMDHVRDWNPSLHDPPRKVDWFVTWHTKLS